MKIRHLFLALALALPACTGGGRETPPSGRDTVVVFAASSLAAPMRGLLDDFSKRTGAVIQEEHGASLDLARRITDLHRVPDVIVLADQEVFSELLVPKYASWYARFAGNRMVVAYTDRSRHSAEMRAAAWWETLLRDDVLVGRADPAVAPAGYRALLMFGLAERFYQQPGLARRLADRSPPRLQRANAAELAALLEAGEVDYIIEYESLARSHGFRFVTLPPEVDLGNPRHADTYAAATVRVRRGQDSVTIKGAPILYAVSVPRAAPHADAGARFVATMLGPEGWSLLQRENVAMLSAPVLVGDSVPPVVRERATP